MKQLLKAYSFQESGKQLLIYNNFEYSNYLNDNIKQLAIRNFSPSIVMYTDTKTAAPGYHRCNSICMIEVNKWSGGLPVGMMC